MSFRARLALASALAVAAAVVAASLAAYVVVRDQLEGGLDRSLTSRLDDAAPGRPGAVRPIAPGRFGGPGAYVQIATADGQTYRPANADVALPVSQVTRAVAAGERAEAFENADDLLGASASRFRPLDDGLAVGQSRGSAVTGDFHARRDCEREVSQPQ